MKEIHRLGRIHMAPELLLDILDLDREHRVVAVRDRGPDMNRPATIEIIVSGPRMPEVSPGELAPEVQVTYRRKDYGLVEVRRAHQVPPE